MKNSLKIWFLLLGLIFLFLFLFCIFYEVQSSTNASVVELNGVQIIQVANNSSLHFEVDQTLQVKLNGSVFSVKVSSVSEDQNFIYLYLNKWIYNVTSEDRFSILGKNITFGEFIFSKVF